MAKKAVAPVAALVRDKAKRNVDSEDDYIQAFHERALSEEYLFEGADERGYRGWFLRIAITGLWTRRVGPFADKEEAVALLEDFLGKIVMGPLCDVGNDMGMRPGQVCLVEGVPQLVAPVQEG